MKLVVNASPLILLSAASQLQILKDLAEEIVVPLTVLQELEAGAHRDDVAERVQQIDWIRAGNEGVVPTEISAWDLGPGESSVLAWAKNQSGYSCVLDDRAARACARSLQLSCVGTLGLVLEAKDVGLIPAARPVLEAMIRAGYYLGERLVRQALVRVGE
ncbi:MAG: DUF3368 domain-containing protein [Acidobacteriota bacterium]